MPWDYITTPAGILDPRVAALLAIVITQALKAHLPEGKAKAILTNILCLAVTMAITLATAILFQPDKLHIYEAITTALWATFVATFGYEIIKNTAELLGIYQQGDPE